MDARPDVHPSVSEGPLGTVPAGDTRLGPISPELALVDPVLAERARQLLPAPREQPRPRPPVASAPPSIPPRRRRWRRTVVFAVLVFAAGAASGGFLGRNRAAPTQVKLEARPASPTTSTRTGATKPSPGQPRRVAGTPALRPPSATVHSRPKRAAARGRRPAGVQVPRRRPRATPTRRREPVKRVIWAANVLGVEAQVDGRGVSLAWLPPVNSGHVVVVRTRHGRRHGVVVFRGGGKSFRDASARSCTDYSYTIVNVDRRGHRSTGVPTSVVTGGCT